MFLTNEIGGGGGGVILEPEDVLSVAQAGSREVSLLVKCCVSNSSHSFQVI